MNKIALLITSLLSVSAAAAADPVWVRVAAADSPAEAKAAADFVCTGTNDELTIQKAVDACATGEKDLWLFNGLYLIDDVHSFPDGGPLTAVRLTNMHRDFVVRGQSWYAGPGPGRALMRTERLYV